MHQILFIQLPLFLILSIVCFTTPGIFLLEKSKIRFSFWEKLILGTCLGFIFFTLLSYSLVILKLHLLLLPIIVLINILSIRIIPSLFSQITFLPKINLAILSLVFLIGIIGQLLIIAPSGIYRSGDLVFWSSHGHDGFWHIALMEEYKKGYPLLNPVFAGERLVNYHFFSDIAPAEFNRYFKLSTLDLYFRFFPLMFSILLGALAYLLGKKLGGFQAGLWASIFTYFAGSFGYIVTYLQSKTFGGESLFWASQIQSSIGNPPQIAAFIIVLTFLYLFDIFLKNRSKALLTICAILVGSLAVFKVYGAVVLVISVFLVGLWQLVRKKGFSILLLSLAGACFSAILLLPNSTNYGSFLIFEPWWFIRTMVVAPDRLNWLDLELKRQTYIFEGNWKRVIQVELTAFLIFFFGNLGMRLLGLWSFWKLLKSSLTNYFNQLLLTTIIVSFILPILFLQKGVAANTIQFLQYFLLLFGFLVALTVANILKRIKSKFVVILVGFTIILLSVPTQLSLIISFYNRLPFAKVSATELSALKFLKDNITHESIVLTAPYNKYLDLHDPIPNIWDWSDSAYVSALTNKRVYLADTEQVTILGYDLSSRLKFQEEIFAQEDPTTFTRKLQENRIDYIYFPKSLKPAVELDKSGLKKVYSNDLVEIWQVDTEENQLE